MGAFGRLSGLTPEGNLTLEKEAVCDWLSSTCVTEELRSSVFSIYDRMCFFVVNSLERVLIYFHVGYYLNCINPGIECTHDSSVLWPPHLLRL